jgi:hypothetical protein
MPVLLPAERRWPSSQDEAPNQWTTSQWIHSMDVRDSLYCMSDGQQTEVDGGAGRNGV